MSSGQGPRSTIAATGPPPCGPWCIASTETKTAGSPIAAAATPPDALAQVALPARADRELDRAHRRMLTMHLEKELRAARVLHAMSRTNPE